MKQIVVFARGTLAAADRKRLEDAGVIAIEAKDPSKVTMLLPSETPLKASELLMCAMEAICSPTASQSVQAEMALAMFKRMKRREGGASTVKENETAK